MPPDKPRVGPDAKAYAKDTKPRIRHQNKAADVVIDYMGDAYAKQVLEPLRKRIAEWAERALFEHARR